MNEKMQTEIDLQNILWRTRGYSWDYTFVIFPKDSLGKSWYEIHSQVFKEITPSAEAWHLGGSILVDSKLQRFAATTFLDTERCDVVGRQVAHYIIWLLPSDRHKEPVLKLPGGWGQRLVFEFGDALNKTFHLSPSCENFDGALEKPFIDTRSRLRSIQLSGTDTTISLQESVIVEKKTKNFDAPWLFNLAVIVGATALLIILAVILNISQL